MNGSGENKNIILYPRVCAAVLNKWLDCTNIYTQPEIEGLVVLNGSHPVWMLKCHSAFLTRSRVQTLNGRSHNMLQNDLYFRQHDFLVYLETTNFKLSWCIISSGNLLS